MNTVSSITWAFVVNTQEWKEMSYLDYTDNGKHRKYFVMGKNAQKHRIDSASSDTESA